MRLTVGASETVVLNSRSPITRFVTGVGVLDIVIATLRGLTLSARRRGVTLASARIGERDAGMGIHVYQRAPRLAAFHTFLRARREK